MQIIWYQSIVDIHFIRLRIHESHWLKNRRLLQVRESDSLNRRFVFARYVIG